MRLVLVFLIILFAYNSNAQYTGNFSYSSAEFTYKYIDFIDSTETIIRPWYHYVVTEKNGSYILRQFEPETLKLLSKVTFLDVGLRVKNGASIELFPNTIHIGNFQDNKKVGLWRTLNKKGSTIGKQFFGKNGMDGNYSLWYDDGVLKKKTKYLGGKKNGKATEFYSNGRLKVESNYLNDELDGEYLEYDSTGRLETQAVYKNDEVVKYLVGKELEQIDALPNFEGCKSKSEERFRKCQMDKMYKHLTDLIIYPPDAEYYEMQGRVFVKFKVDKEGGVSDIEIIKGLSQGMNNEAIRIVESMPKWIPGRHNDKIVPVYYTLPIVYSLN